MNRSLVFQAVVVLVIAFVLGRTLAKWKISAPQRTKNENGAMYHSLSLMPYGASNDEEVQHTAASMNPAALFEDYFQRRSTLAKIALAAWAEHDPDAALRRVIKEKRIRNAERELWLRIVFDVMALQNPDALLEKEKELNVLTRGSGYLAEACAFQALALEDPVAAWRRAKQRGVPPPVYRAIFQVWAAVNPSAVEAAVAKERDRAIWKEAIQVVAEARFRKDPESARAWLTRFPHRNALDAGLVEKRWNQADPDDAAERLRVLLARHAEGDEIDDMSVFWEQKHSLFEASHMSLAEDEFLEILATFDEPEYVAETLFPAYPAEKRARLLLDSGVHHDYPVSDIVRDTAIELARESPAKARAWAAQIEDNDTDTRAHTVGDIFRVMSYRDPEGTLAALAQVEDGEARDLINSNSGLPTFDHLTTLEFANAVEEFESDHLKTWLKRHSLPWAIAGESTTDALAWIENLPPEERHVEQGTALLYSMIEETGKDHAAVLAWAIESLPEGTFAPGSFGPIAYSWEQHNREAAANWLSTLDDGPWRDAAIKGFITSNAPDEYSEAYLFAASISDRDQRQASVGKLLHYWAVDDPHAMAVVLDDADDADVTVDVRAQLREHLERQLNREKAHR